MNLICRVCRALLGITIGLVLVMPLAVPCMPEDKRITQTAGVDNTKMGAYRALAQLSLRAFQKGDSATASELARILERTWDAAEGGGSDASLVKTNKDLFGRIDHAMDVFIEPIMDYATNAPDPAAVQVAYNKFLDILRQGD
jgi:hypothetical protein